MIKERFSEKLKEILSSDDWLILQPEYEPEDNLKYESFSVYPMVIWESGEVMKKAGK